MPPKKKSARKAAKKPEKSFEESLWDTATKLRGSVESSDWSGATETTRQGSPKGERGCDHQYSRAERDRLPMAARRADAEASVNHVVLSLIFLKFEESHHGSKKDISVYGQDQWAWGAHLRRAKRARRVRQLRKLPNQFTATTYKLAKMNLAVRGLSANLGEVPADTFFKDQHPDLKADYIMANPPFNLKDWRAADELVHDGRWNGYDTPPTGNANYAWILHMVSKLSEHGVAGFCKKVTYKAGTMSEGIINAFPVPTEVAA